MSFTSPHRLKLDRFNDDQINWSIISPCPRLHFSDEHSLIGAMFQYVALAKDKVWQPGPYPGVALLILHKNERTGGLTALRKFAAGVTVPAHTHPEANESVYILSGEWEESGMVYSTGSFFHAPRGERHGPHVAKTEVISLTVFDGPLTVV